MVVLFFLLCGGVFVYCGFALFCSSPLNDVSGVLSRTLITKKNFPFITLCRNVVL